MIAAKIPIFLQEVCNAFARFAMLLFKFQEGKIMTIREKIQELQNNMTPNMTNLFY